MNSTKNSNNNLHNQTIFGFWLYIMSDCILFASLFATYAVLSGNVMISIEKDIFKLPLVFIETLCLLLSSLTYGLAMISAKQSYLKKVKFWMMITFFLGSFFICMEIFEFSHLIKSNHGPNSNAFFSAFFILVGTHGLHVIAGLVWILIMIIHLTYQGLTNINFTRIECLSLFWHFLDIIWICVFTEVYLLIGAL